LKLYLFPVFCPEEEVEEEASTAEEEDAAAEEDGKFPGIIDGSLSNISSSKSCSVPSS